MQMKKIVSVVVAAAMAAAFCVPAYAEATPGGVTNDLAKQILNMNLTAENWDTNKEAAAKNMKEMTERIRKDSAITVSQEMNNAALDYFDAAEGNGDSSISKVEGVKKYYGTGMVYRMDAGASELTVNSFGYNDKGVITMDITEGNVPSEDGYAVSVTLPADGNNNYMYRVSIDGGQLFTVTVPVTSYIDENGQQLYMISFWAPHFTTYKLTPVNLVEDEDQNQDQNQNQNQGGEQQTVTSGDSSNTSSEESTTATTSTVAENPIKATGVSMNMSVFAVVACAAVAACGAGVAVKKSHKGE